jgi:hypothetical protein
MSKVDAIMSKISEIEAELEVSTNVSIEFGVSILRNNCLGYTMLYTKCKNFLLSRIRSIRFLDFGCNC